jgi:hypothetical protein
MINLKNIFIFIMLSFIFSFFFVVPLFASNIDGTITPNPKYGFGENLGWINFGCDNCNVHVTDTGLSGYAWSKTNGWINLSPEGSGVTNNCAGILGGKAWSKSLGWIDFSGAKIEADGKFTGSTEGLGTKAGKINFSCTNCDVSTDWRQCSLRESPAQVLINSIIGNVVPSVTANITITNEGNIDTEYQYEWCVVSDINNNCGGGDDVFYASGAKLIIAGQDWTTNKNAVVSIPGTYYFKLVAHFGSNFSTSTQVFTAVNGGIISGGGGGGGGGASNAVNNSKYDSSDINNDHIVNSADFSIMLYYWGKSYPFNNSNVDINKDGKINSIDFSILLYQWGRKTI